MTRAAIIGYGYWGRILEKYIDENPDFDLHYVCSRSLARFGKQTPDVDDIFSDAGCSAVFIATPIGSHYPLVKAALAAGKDVFCEKPLTIHTKSAIELVKLAENRERTLFVDLTYTFSKGLQRAKAWVDDGLIGELRWLDLNLLKKAERPKNIYWALGTHLLSVVGLFWPLNSLVFNPQDDGQTILFHDTGIGGIMRTSQEYPGKKVEFTLIGDKGIIRYQPETLSIWQDSGETGDWVFDESNNLRFAVSYFADVLAGKKATNVKTAVEITCILESSIGGNSCM